MAPERPADPNPAPHAMVPLARLPPFQARLLAARLGAEGIVWQLRGESSVYPFATVDVLVEADLIQDARDIVSLGGLGEETAAGSIPAGRRSRRSRVGLLIVGLIALALLAELTLAVGHLL